MVLMEARQRWNDIALQSHVYAYGASIFHGSLSLDKIRQIVGWASACNLESRLKIFFGWECRLGHDPEGDGERDGQGPISRRPSLLSP